jgi:hydrid cluster protein-associated redox disulfide domain
MATVDKAMTIRQVLEMDPGAARIMMTFGLHCLGCPHATMETLEEAGVVHGINVDEMIHQLNEHLKEGNA